MTDVSTVGDWLRWAASRLGAGDAGARLDAELLLAFATGQPRSAILAFPERRPAPAACVRLRRLVRRRRMGVPLAYLTGEKAFYSVTVEVGPDVLVPRPETELLVDEALARLGRGAPAPSVLDLGTGSGAIALAVKREWPAARVAAADSSAAALARAGRNARLLGLDVELVATDWWAALEGRRFDLVVCNPPYVASGDPHFEGPLRFEPRAALDGGDDGLGAIRRVLAGAARHVTAGGALLLEHGQDQRAAVTALAAPSGLRVAAVRDDLAGRPRLAVLEVDRGR